MIMAVKSVSPADDHFGYPFGVDGLMSIEEACDFLGKISRDTLGRLVAEGSIRKGHFPKRNKAVVCRRSVTEYAKSTEI